ncbi:MAG: substrate-binding domain-containing protein, partial [Muribaculaceae bacterium]|nr:substrate-binding domain-containing protein [Muribaculaceae bacterium]
MKAISFIRKAIAGVWVASAFCLATGCGGEGSGPKYRIGISQPSDDYWRQKSNEDIERGAMFHENVELDFRSANNNSGRQREDVEKFIEEGCDLIILSPHDATDIMPTVRKAREKGIPVVTFDRTLDGDDFTAHLEVDNYALAKSVGEYALTVMDRPIRALEIQGPPDSSPAIRRHKGFSDAMAASPGTEIVASVSAMWQDSLAYALADSILALHPEINLIYAHTDYMALGAEKAARERGRDDITVLGIDGVPHIGIRGVRDGRLTATFLYPTEGERLMALAVNILEGKPYDRINLTPPLPPIDRTNAEIMLAQDSLLNLETDRIKLMRGKLHEYLDRNTAQRLLLYAVLIIALLLGVVTFVSLRAVAIYRRQRAALEERNVRLKEEKAKQQVLYNRLEEATQSKLTFFTNVSHDLRTPLTLVAGPVEEMAHADYLTPRHNSLMQTARRNVNILRRLIDQILDFRKYENGKADLHLSEVDAGRLIRLWTDDFMEAGRRRDIKISCTISPEGGIVCAMDVEKLERVFFNL